MLLLKFLKMNSPWPLLKLLWTNNLSKWVNMFALFNNTCYPGAFQVHYPSKTGLSTSNATLHNLFSQHT